MEAQLREFFDKHLEVVLAELPQQVKDFMEEVPLVVEDYPSREVMQRMGIRHPRICLVCTLAFHGLSGALSSRECHRM